MEASIVKQETGQILLTNDNEVFVMNYDVDDCLCGDDPLAENNKHKEQEPVRKQENNKHKEQEPVPKQVASEIEEQGLEDVDIKEEELQVCNGENNINKKSSNENNDRLKEDKWINRKLKKNLETADPSRKVICAICGFKAIKKHHLSNHIQLAHPRKPPPKSDIFDCKYCMFSSRYKGSLTQHMSAFHMDQVLSTDSQTPGKKKSSYEVQSLKVEDHSTLGNDQIYSCNYCSYTSTVKKFMRIHIPVHVIEKKPVKQCPHCPVRYTEAALNIHVRKIHNPDGVFNCSKCHYVTRFKNNLRRHMRRNANLEKCIIMHAKKASLYSKDPEVKEKSSNKKNSRNKKKSSNKK